jgi:hypothetical protein
MDMATVAWSTAGQLDWWVKERQEWWVPCAVQTAVNGGSELLIFVEPLTRQRHDLDPTAPQALK